MQLVDDPDPRACRSGVVVESEEIAVAFKNNNIDIQPGPAVKKTIPTAS